MKPKRMLVVVGNLSEAEFITDELRRQGVDHLLVTSAGSALDMAQFHEHFDTLLTGLSLPERSGGHVDPFAGFQLALKIRQEIPDIKVVFTTKLDISTARGLLPTGLHPPVRFLPKRSLPKDLRRAIR